MMKSSFLNYVIFHYISTGLTTESDVNIATTICIGYYFHAILYTRYLHHLIVNHTVSLCFRVFSLVHTAWLYTVHSAVIVCIALFIPPYLNSPQARRQHHLLWFFKLQVTHAKISEDLSYYPLLCSIRVDVCDSTVH